jgi:hypothetical protein
MGVFIGVRGVSHTSEVENGLKIFFRLPPNI